MPRWDLGRLPKPPRFNWRSLPLLLGPGLVCGSAAIGGGEWLTGPLVTARYGGAMLWLATLSILGQTLYNIEISRYTLYCGEPIFTGKFRTPPGPLFWLSLYLLLDFGSLLPYLASSAAVPLYAMFFHRLPDPQRDVWLLKGLACLLFVALLVPLLVGGRVYRSLKWMMTFKLVFVMGFLLLLAVLFATPDTWREVLTGFFRFGTFPLAESPGSSGPPQTANVISLWLSGQSLPAFDFSMLGILAAFAAIAGNGGLSNAPISNYTRDQGWGMGRHVGAIPSFFAGHAISLSHVGMVFPLTAGSLRRWFGWIRHVHREQILVWAPACFLGVALPAMLSLMFLPRGTVLEDKWLAAGMTADGVAEAVGPYWSGLFWQLTLFCGLVVLATSIAAVGDGVLRRWVDVFWTASPRLRQMESRHIGRFYFGVLCVYSVLGLTMLTLVDATRLLIWSTNIYNYALGISCWHTIAVNRLLLPAPLRPGLFRCLGLFLAGAFFVLIAVLTTLNTFGMFNK